MEITYNEFINNILSTRGNFGIQEGYKERHHIIPRCMGGSDDKENLVDLYAREHFIVHKLLANENPDNYKLQLAFTMMAFVKSDNQERYEITAEEYELAKCILSKVQSERNVGELNPNYGNHYSEESKQHMKDVWHQTHPIRQGITHSEETKKKISNANRGKKRTDEFKQRISDLWSGVNNPRCKKVYCLETDIVYDYISQAASILNINRNAITKSANTGGIEGHCGYHFVYSDNIISNEEKECLLQQIMQFDIEKERIKKEHYKHTPEQNENNRQKHLGKKHTEESKKKMSLKKSGENHPFYGKHHSEKTKQQISDTKKRKNKETE